MRAKHPHPAIATVPTRYSGRGTEMPSFPSGAACISEASKRCRKPISPPSHLHPSFSCVFVKVARRKTLVQETELWTTNSLDLLPGGYAFLVLSGGGAFSFPRVAWASHLSHWRTTRPVRNPAGRSQPEHSDWELPWSLRPQPQLRFNPTWSPASSVFLSGKRPPPGRRRGCDRKLRQSLADQVTSEVGKWTEWGSCASFGHSNSFPPPFTLTSSFSGVI